MHKTSGEVVNFTAFFMHSTSPNGDCRHASVRRFVFPYLSKPSTRG